MKRFSKIVDDFYPLIIFAKRSITRGGGGGTPMIITTKMNVQVASGVTKRDKTSGKLKNTE